MRTPAPFFDAPSGPVREWTDTELTRSLEGSPGGGARAQALAREAHRRRTVARDRARAAFLATTTTTNGADAR